MRLTAILRRATTNPHQQRLYSATNATQAPSSSATASRRRKSLALSAYFSHPDLTGGKVEILSRATAFLWGIDPPQPGLSPKAGPYAHLEVAAQRRKERELKQTEGYTPAAPGGTIKEMGWLEFVPREYRPNVHVVASSHVLSPFLWKEYYPQGWLSVVRQEHCSYALEVYDEDDHQTGTATASVDKLSNTKVEPPKPLVKLALHPTPYHHPEGRDIALIHLKEEEASLKILNNLGVDILYSRDTDKLYQKGETMYFEGYAVEEPNNKQQEPAVTPAEADDPWDSDLFDEDDSDDDSDKNEDLRIFQPYREEGQLSFHTDDRFFASTPKPLPEGLCGAPVLDTDGDLCGVVEGIVPTDHANKKLAGSAAFIPSFQLAAFVEYCERQMLQQIMPADLFQMVVTAKKTNSVTGEGPTRRDSEGNVHETNWDEAHSALIDNLKQKYSPEEVESFLQIVRNERDEAVRIMEEEGGDVDDVVARVREKTLEQIHEAYLKSQEETKKAE